ncbi:MAG TPA: hypothetical protein ENL20_02785 [Candidatus Cloacimonetes bacterium]|nr:hypothetical protein [Candidatus Cloacimonadota bacterium]
MDVQEDIAVVKNVNDKTVTIRIKKTDSCKSCSLKGVCGTSSSPIEHKLKTDLELEAGDLVKVYLSPGVKIFSSFIIFVFPILLMILFYFLGKILFKSENLAILISIFGLLFSGIIIYFIDKKYAKKIHFEIVEKVLNSEQNKVITK